MFKNRKIEIIKATAALNFQEKILYSDELKIGDWTNVLCQDGFIRPTGVITSITYPKKALRGRAKHYVIHTEKIDYIVAYGRHDD